MLLDRLPVLSGSSLTRPTGSFEEVFLTWFGAAGFACGKSGQVSGFAIPGVALGKVGRQGVESLDGKSGLGMPSFSALIQVWPAFS